MKTIFVGFFVLILFLSVTSAATLTIIPDGSGFYSDWVNNGCASGSEWQCVDELNANTTDFLSSSSNNVIETFTFGNTGLTSEAISSVALYYYAERVNSNKNKIEPLIRASSTNYIGNTITLSASYSLYSQTYTTNPATGSSWTVAEIDALEAGMKTANAKGGGKVAQAYAVVNYTPNLPDLIVDSINFIEYMIVNITNNVTYVNVSTTVKNIGAGSAGSSWTKLSYLSTQNYFTSALVSGASTVINITYECVSAHSFNATADVFSTVSESSEGNNGQGIFIDCVV